MLAGRRPRMSSCAVGARLGNIWSTSPQRWADRRKGCGRAAICWAFRAAPRPSGRAARSRLNSPNGCRSGLAKRRASICAGPSDDPGKSCRTCRRSSGKSAERGCAPRNWLYRLVSDPACVAFQSGSRIHFLRVGACGRVAVQNQEAQRQRFARAAVPALKACTTRSRSWGFALEEMAGVGSHRVRIIPIRRTHCKSHECEDVLARTSWPVPSVPGRETGGGHFVPLVKRPTRSRCRRE